MLLGIPLRWSINSGLQSSLDELRGYKDVNYKAECYGNCAIRFFVGVGVDETVIFGVEHLAGLSSKVGGAASIAGLVLVQMSFNECMEKCKNKGGACKPLGPDPDKPDRFSDNLRRRF
jgi:hypothetical protein